MSGPAAMQVDVAKEIELQLLEQTKRLVAQQDIKGMVELVQSMKTAAWVEEVSKAKTAKFLKQCLDALASIPGSMGIHQDLVNELIGWAKAENRAYLKLYLETRLVSLYLDLGKYQESLALIQTLLKDLRRLDDKMMLLEVQLLESRVHYAVKSLARAKAALTAARTSANAIYCPPPVQAGLDMQSGMLYAEERDFKTAYSYFYEAFEGLVSIEDPKALVALKYMLLCKIMMTQPEEVLSFVQGKAASKYTGPQIDAMIAVARAYKNRSLKEFEGILRQYEAELQQDVMVRSHLSSLYDGLLEQNLIKLIEPYSYVELAHLATLIELPPHVVEAKLSQMILDKSLSGMLDQGSGCLVVLDEPEPDKSYEHSLAIIKQMDRVVDALYQRASIIN